MVGKGVGGKGAPGPSKQQQYTMCLFQRGKGNKGHKGRHDTMSVGKEPTQVVGIGM